VIVRAIRVLEQIGGEIGLPQGIVLENDSRFTSPRLLLRAQESVVAVHFNEPVQNAFAERFSERFRDECRNKN
jgi:hypothetical protein